MKPALCLFAALSLLPLASAQTTSATRQVIVAQGNATASAKPDQAKIQIGVVTQAATAQEATQQNAVQTSSVIAALQAALGANADIKTTNYSVTPVYSSPRAGEQAQLTGYTVNNTVEVTISDLTIVGRMIDAATAAGANRILSLRFTLKDEDPLRLQALRQASVEAKRHADAMAAGVGLRTGNILAIQEGNVSVISPIRSGAGLAASATTPIESGTVDVTASVTMEVELLR